MDTDGMAGPNMDNLDVFGDMNQNNQFAGLETIMEDSKDLLADTQSFFPGNNQNSRETEALNQPKKKDETFEGICNDIQQTNNNE